MPTKEELEKCQTRIFCACGNQLRTAIGGGKTENPYIVAAVCRGEHEAVIPLKNTSERG